MKNKIILTIVAVVAAIVIYNGYNPEPEPQESPRTELVHSQFSSWDGSHRGLVKYVKSVMNDPSSFEHVETGFRDEGDHIFVAMKFRGKNAFGAMVLQQIAADVDFQGNVIKIVDE